MIFEEQATKKFRIFNKKTVTINTNNQYIFEENKNDDNSPVWVVTFNVLPSNEYGYKSVVRKYEKYEKTLDETVEKTLSIERPPLMYNEIELVNIKTGEDFMKMFDFKCKKFEDTIFSALELGEDYGNKQLLIVDEKGRTVYCQYVKENIKVTSIKKAGFTKALNDTSKESGVYSIIYSITIVDEESNETETKYFYEGMDMNWKEICTDVNLDKITYNDELFTLVNACNNYISKQSKKLKIKFEEPNYHKGMTEEKFATETKNYYKYLNHYINELKVELKKETKEERKEEIEKTLTATRKFIFKIAENTLTNIPNSVVYEGINVMCLNGGSVKKVALMPKQGPVEYVLGSSKRTNLVEGLKVSGIVKKETFYAVDILDKTKVLTADTIQDLMKKLHDNGYTVPENYRKKAEIME